MLIGILETGKAPDALVAEAGNYPDMFQGLLAGEGFKFRTYCVVDMQFPESVEACDGWILTGSRHGAYEDHPFIPPLEAFIREAYDKAIPMVGICFGHQIIAQALGGRVEKFKGGWNVGAQDYDFEGETIRLGLNASDFQTANKVVQAINSRHGMGTATALDGRTVEVRAPMHPGARVGFIADIEELQLTGSRPAAKVVINARTGSIVMNQAVTLGPCAIAHGNLAITIDSTPVISQPNALSQGQTVVREKANIQVHQEPGSIVNVPSSPQLSDVVRSLNALGATPQDMLAILQALKSAGALQAELEVI